MGPFNIKDAIDILGIEAGTYYKDKIMVVKELKLPVETKTIKDLAVLYGCTQVIPFANDLIDNYKDYYKQEKSAIQQKQMDWDNPQFILAAFHLTCFTMGVF
jgi:hypothetical protein